MNRQRLEADLRHYRHQHRKRIAERAEWLRRMNGQRTGQVRWIEERAAQCRQFAHEKIEALRELRQ
jgi:hypothetical protein